MVSPSSVSDPDAHPPFLCATCAALPIAVSFAHAYGGSKVPLIMVYSLMIPVTLEVGQLDVFASAGRICVMLLITFAVVDNAFVVSVAQTNFEKGIGVDAWFSLVNRKRPPQSNSGKSW